MQVNRSAVGCLMVTQAKSLRSVARIRPTRSLAHGYGARRDKHKNCERLKYHDVIWDSATGDGSIPFFTDDNYKIN